MFKSSYRIVLLFMLGFILVSWGSKGHYIINNKCPQSFPASMSAFRVWADSLDIHGSDADNRKSKDPSESPKHYIDIDNYSEFKNYGKIASTYDSIVNIHGSSYVLNNGTLPWATVNMYDTLIVDFQKLKWHKAMLDASDLGHYVADGHMPLHITANYDGQKTGQNGIHSRYETNMVYSYQTELANYSGDSVHFISNINNYVMSYIYSSNRYVDSVLMADTYAQNLAENTTSTQYNAALWSKTQFTTKLFHDASHSLAELIYNAWLEAGSPAFGATSVSNSINSVFTGKITVFPNPTSGIVKLAGDSILKIEVTTLTGKKLFSVLDNQIDLSELSNGMYILTLFGNNGIMQKEKVLLTK